MKDTLLIEIQKIEEKNEIDIKDVLIIVHIFAQLNMETIQDTNLALKNLHEVYGLLNDKINTLEKRIKILEEMM